MKQCQDLAPIPNWREVFSIVSSTLVSLAHLRQHPALLLHLDMQPGANFVF